MYCTIGDIRIPVNFAALLVVGQILVVVLVVNVPDYSPTVLVARWQFREGHCCVPLATLERDVGFVRRGFGMPEGAIPPDRAGLVAPTRDGYLQCYYIHGVSIKIIIIVDLRECIFNAYLLTIACKRGSTGGMGTTNCFLAASAPRRPCGFGGLPMFKLCDCCVM